jgi:hypothetical protein
MINLGSFNVNSGKVVVSDPCYDRGTWCQAVLENVKNGEWIADVKQSDEGSWGIRNAELIAYHSGYGMPKDYQWTKTSHDIGVDSGQAGIYDDNFYRNDSLIGEIKNSLHFNLDEDGERFYSLNCDLTCRTENNGGVMEQGVVSTSGYGDGGYDLFIVEQDGQVVAMKVVFISDEDTCEECGEPESECSCTFCEDCNEREQYCECEYCDNCGENERYCECEDEEDED